MAQADTSATPLNAEQENQPSQDNGIVTLSQHESLPQDELGYVIPGTYALPDGTAIIRG